MAYTYREQKFYCGEYLEVNIYPVFPAPAGRGKKKKASSPVQEKLNEKNAERKLIRILNANFTPDDFEIHLTYSDENLPHTEEEAIKDMRNYLRRVKRLRAKRELPALKYVAVIEGGGEQRYHFHITLNGGIDRDELENLWQYGYANARRLQFNENGVEALGKYITKQFRQKKEKGEIVARKRWTASKGLINPVPQERDGRISHKRAKRMTEDNLARKELAEKLYPGYRYASADEFYNDVNGGYYLSIRMYSDKALMKQKKRKLPKGEICENNS